MDFLVNRKFGGGKPFGHVLFHDFREEVGLVQVFSREVERYDFVSFSLGFRKAEVLFRRSVKLIPMTTITAEEETEQIEDFFLGLRIREASHEKPFPISELREKYKDIVR